MISSTFLLSNQRLFAAAILLAIAPLWFGNYLPMVDVPQHAGQIAALQELHAGNSGFEAAFEVNWFTPYLFGYLLLYTLATLMPIAFAIKFVVCAAMISVPLLTGLLLREVGADTRWRWLAIPGCYSLAFYWGFVSFMVAVPLGLLLLILTIRFDRDPTPRRGTLLAGFAVFLFFCHVIALGLAALAAGSYLAGRHYRAIRTLALRCLPLAAPLPLIAAWIAITYDAEGTVQNAPVVYGPVLNRFLSLISQPSGLERVTVFGALVTASMVVLPAITGAKLSRDPARWLPFAATAIAFFAVPSFAFNTGFLYQRLGVFLAPLWLMVWDARPNANHRLEFLGMVLVAAWMILNTARFASFARETQWFDAITAEMQPRENVAMMIVDNRSPLFATPVYLHFPAWYQAKKRGIVDFNFADFHPQVVRYKASRGPRVNEALAWAPWHFQWELHGGASYRYFIVKGDRDYSSVIFKDRVGSVDLIARSGWWWLYESRERQ